MKKKANTHTHMLTVGERAEDNKGVGLRILSR